MNIPGYRPAGIYSAGTEEEILCDTLLLSVGLIPENELSEKIGIKMNLVTSGPMLNESLETSVAGVFACGNVIIDDIADTGIALVTTKNVESSMKEI